MTKTTASMVKEMKPFVADMVEQKLLELLGDPESTLKLSSAAKKRLSKCYPNNEFVPAKQAASKLGLKW